MQFNEILKLMRRRKCLTQEKLADFLHVDQSAISDWENNITMPSIDYLIELAKLFELTLDELVGLTPNSEINRLFSLDKILHAGKVSIVELCKLFNVTEKELADAMGTTKKTIRNWETKGLPYIDLYKKIFEFFDLDKETFMSLK